MDVLFLRGEIKLQCQEQLDTVWSVTAPEQDYFRLPEVLPAQAGGALVLALTWRSP